MKCEEFGWKRTVNNVCNGVLLLRRASNSLAGVYLALVALA
jgi:hypothetical protein